MIILLNGLRGSGKTEVGKQVAQKLNLKFVEFDQLVLEHVGLDQDHASLRQKPSLWKEAELEVAKDLSTEEKLVVACSGGFLENELNLQYFKENNTVLHNIYLSAEPKTLSTRTTNIDKSILEKTFEKRDPIYKNLCETKITTDHKQPKEVVSEVINAVI